MGWVEEHCVKFIVEFAILETTIGGSIWRRREGGGFRDIEFFDYFFVAPMLYFSERGMENKEEIKIMNGT